MKHTIWKYKVSLFIFHCFTFFLQTTILRTNRLFCSRNSIPIPSMVTKVPNYPFVGFPVGKLLSCVITRVVILWKWLLEQDMWFAWLLCRKFRNSGVSKQPRALLVALHLDNGMEMRFRFGICAVLRSCRNSTSRLTFQKKRYTVFSRQLSTYL